MHAHGVYSWRAVDAIASQITVPAKLWRVWGRRKPVHCIALMQICPSPWFLALSRRGAIWP